MFKECEERAAREFARRLEQKTPGLHLYAIFILGIRLSDRELKDRFDRADLRGKLVAADIAIASDMSDTVGYILRRAVVSPDLLAKVLKTLADHGPGHVPLKPVLRACLSNNIGVACAAVAALPLDPADRKIVARLARLATHEHRALALAAAQRLSELVDQATDPSALAPEALTQGLEKVLCSTGTDRELKLQIVPIVGRIDTDRGLGILLKAYEAHQYERPPSGRIINQVAEACFVELSKLSFRDGSSVGAAT